DDLRQPLLTLSGFLELLSEQFSEVLDDDGRMYVERAMSGADRMRQLVRDLLEYSRVSTRTHPFGRVDMQDLVQTVAGELGAELDTAGATVDVQGLPTVQGDGFQLSQLV